MKFSDWFKVPQEVSVQRTDGPIVMYIPSELTECSGTETAGGEEKI